MSCWVVPSIAAELWGVSVSHVLNLAESQGIPSKNELGFLLVDVAPDSPQLCSPRREKHLRPRTFKHAVRLSTAAAASSADAVAVLEPESPTADEEGPYSWLEARNRSSRCRKLRAAPADRSCLLP